MNTQKPETGLCDDDEPVAHQPPKRDEETPEIDYENLFTAIWG